MQKLQLVLFYLLVIFLPTQLGRHFFFDFSYISGIRSDYLAPTIFLTDAIAILIIGIELLQSLKSTAKNLKPSRLFLLAVIGYLLFNSLFIASSKWVALYKLLKIIEFIALGYVIVKIKPKLEIIIALLSFGVLYSSIIAVWQFIVQKSVGGLWWFLGERTFYAGTPGIAALSIGGRLILRPYATFPHPNILGGFLAVMIPLMLVKVRSQTLWFFPGLILGIVVLVLTASRAAWVIASFGVLLVLLNRDGKLTRYLNKNKGRILVLFYLLLTASVLFFMLIFPGGQSIKERKELVITSLTMISKSPLTGVGLNNFILRAKDYLPRVFDPYIFQPVHNIYLLILSETGIIGFTLFLFFVSAVFFKSLKALPVLAIAIVQLLLLGFFDHYLLTLQQGQLLFTIFTSLAFLPKKT